MKNVTEETYLGDLISCVGKNAKNIAQRISKGIGSITQIIHLLEIMSLGEHYMEIALLLRESMLVNGILTNSEIWYGLTNSEINEFEDLDRLFLRRILKVPISTPQEAFHLELGILPIGIIIKARRINYLHYLVSRRKSEMLHQFFITQWNRPCKGDWTETVRGNLEEFDIPIDLDYIRNKSKVAFTKIVKEKAKELALKLLRMKQSTHKKMKSLIYKELKPQSYLSLAGIKVEEVRNIFRFRVRMAPFGENFRGFKDKSMCPLCENHLDDQKLSFQCEAIKEKKEIVLDINNIYDENIEIETARKLTEMLRIREQLLKEKKKKVSE